MNRLIRFFSSSVRGRLTLLVAAVTAPAVLLVALLMVQAYHNEREAVTRHLTATTRAIAALVDQQLGEYEALLKGLAISPDLEQGNLSSFDARARLVLPDTEKWIALIDTEGNQLINTLLPPQTPLARVPLHEDSWKAARRGRTFVSNLAVGQVSKVFRLYVSVPIFRDGTLKYTLSLVMSPSAFARTLDLGRIVPGNVVTIIDRNGTIVARSRGGERLVGRKATEDMVQAAQSRSHGVVNSVTLEGISVLAAFNRTPHHGWSVLIGVPHAELYASARRLLWLGLGLSCLLIVSAILITSWIGRAVVHSVETLMSDVEAIGQGSRPPERTSGLAETDFVARAMRSTAQRLTEKEKDNATLYHTLQNELVQQQRAEEVTRRLAAIVESSNDAIISENLEGIVTSWNQGAQQVLGYTPAEIIGQPITRIIPPKREGEESAILERIRRGERIDHFETLRRHKDGHLVAVSLTVSPIRDHTGQILGASKIGRDITERRAVASQQQALYELVATVNRAAALPEIYQAALEAIASSQKPDRAAILLCDADGVMRFKAARGLSEEYQRAVEGHSPWACGESAPLSIGIENVAAARFEPALRETLAREGIGALAFIPVTYEKRLLGKFVIYYNRPHPFRPDELRPAETIASQVAFALERQKSAAALEALVDERTVSLREAIAQMQEFSYSVSHDLRTPVRAMQGYAEVILEDYGGQLGPEGRELLRRIQRNSSRMDRLIQDLLVYSRLNRREIALEPVPLEKLITEVIQHYPELQAPTVRIDIARPLHDVMAHEPSLSQVISNLLTNATKFVAPGARAHVHIRSEHKGANVRVWFEDNGIGIKPEYQSRLFGLFERIHPDKQYEGTGIGLAIVRKAVERMNGTVGMESDGHSGSKFWLELPSAG